MRKRILILGVLLAMIPIITLAWDIGDPLVPCGTSKNPTPCSFCNIFTLGQNIVDFLTKAIAPALAVLAFALAGFKILISGGSPGRRQEGINIIKNTIIGLLIVFGAWIIIGELLIFFAGTFFSTSGGKMPWDEIICISPVVIKEAPLPTDLTTHAGIKAELLSTGKITINNECPQPYSGATNCTNLDELPLTAINGLKTLVGASGCNCSIVITGGTEYGHETHGKEKARVDLRFTGAADPIMTYIASYSGVTSSGTSKGTLYFLPNGISFLLETIPGPTHWHVSF